MIKELIDQQNFEIANYITGNFSSLVLTKEQRVLIDLVMENERLIVKKTRKLGVSIALQALFSTMLMCQENVKICIYQGNTGYDSGVLGNIKKFIQKSKNKVVVDKITNKKITLANGNYIKIINSPYDISWLKEDDIWFWLDEISFSNKIQPIYDEIIERVKNPKIIITSSPNGIDNLFLPLYILGENAGYKVHDMSWLTSELYVEKAKYVSKLHQKDYDKFYSGKFIIENSDKIDVEEFVKNINKYNKTDKCYNLSGFMSFMNSDAVKKVDASTYPDIEDGYVCVTYNLGLIRTDKIR